MKSALVLLLAAIGAPGCSGADRQRGRGHERTWHFNPGRESIAFARPLKNADGAGIVWRDIPRDAHVADHLPPLLPSDTAPAAAPESTLWWEPLSSEAEPQEAVPFTFATDGPWALTLFAGIHDDDRFLEIITFRGGNIEPSYIAGAALSRHFATTSRYIHWELEGSFYQHWGLQSHWEVNAALVARWTWFPWNESAPTSIAIAQGLSWAGERPVIEDETRRLLNHLFAEVEVYPRRDSPLSLVLRVHHRSGVFGLFGAAGGSNFINAGVRWRF